MQKNPLWIGFFLGAATALGVCGLTYAANRLAGLPLLPFDLFDWLARVLPAAVVNAGVALMVQVIGALRLGPTAATAKLAEQSLAVIEFVLAGGVFGAIVTALGRRDPRRATQAGFWTGAAFLALVLVVEALLGFASGAGVLPGVIWLAAIFLGWGALLGAWARLSAALPEGAAAPNYSTSRRRFITLVGGGSLIVALGGLGLGRLLRAYPAARVSAPTPTPAPEPIQLVGQTNGPAASPPLQALDARIQPAPGTRSEITPRGSFYRVDINTLTPTADAQTWRLSVEGLVDQPLLLSLDQIRAYPSISQAVTLECISNPVGGDLISTGIFTGVPLKTVLAAAGAHAQATWVNVEAFDGFYESLPMSEALDERTLLVYNMDGAPLTPDHGYPLRIYIPGHFGMKQPKWLSRLRISDQQGPGFWVDRGWSATALVQTTAVIDSVALDARDPQTGSVPVGGIAYAGGRGITRVEVQVDDGAWAPAELRVPPLGPLTWVQWRYALPYAPGAHVLRVRATDGSGQVQTAEVQDTFPDGATGYFEHRVVM